MKILAIDTTTKFLCLGLYSDGKFYEYRLLTERRLSELLVPAIRRVVCAAGLNIGDIDYFACGTGPGSFTGLRIGLATVKGLSAAGDKPVIGVPTLDTLASNAGDAAGRLIIAALDARRGLVYCCAYRKGKKAFKRASDYLLLSPGKLAKKFPSPAVILGDALALHKDALSAAMPKAVFLDKDYWGLRTYNLMELALAKAKAKRFSSALTIKPIYLYTKECQIKKR